LLTGKIRIKSGEENTFIAGRINEPDEPIPELPG
jgi:hypothetical protein